MVSASVVPSIERASSTFSRSASWVTSASSKGVVPLAAVIVYALC
jgi:hypothetical protein